MFNLVLSEANLNGFPFVCSSLILLSLRSLLSTVMPPDPVRHLGIRPGRPPTWPTGPESGTSDQALLTSCFLSSFLSSLIAMSLHPHQVVVLHIFLNPE